MRSRLRLKELLLVPMMVVVLLGLDLSVSKCWVSVRSGDLSEPGELRDSSIFSMGMVLIVNCLRLNLLGGEADSCCDCLLALSDEDSYLWGAIRG